MTPSPASPPRVLLAANTDWYLYNFRSALAQRLRAAGFEVHLACPDGPWRGKLQALGFPWHPLPLVRTGTNPLAEWRTFQAFRRLQTSLEPAVTHHFTLQCVVWGSLAVRTTRSGTGLVNALTGMGSLFRGGALKSRLLKAPVKRLLAWALRAPGSHTIFQNPEDQALCVEAFGLPPGATHLIRGSGVDLTRFRPGPRTLEQPVILFVGRLLADKGIREFVEAARLLLPRHPQWRFQVVGSPDPGNPSSLRSEELAALAGGFPGLTFLGHRDDLPELLQEAHLMVLPTRYGEGVPRSLIEGAAAGLPLVASDHPGCREIVRPGLNGHLTPVRSVQALAEAIEAALADPGTWQAMSRASRSLAESEFSEPAVNEATLEVHRHAVARRDLPPTAIS